MSSTSELNDWDVQKLALAKEKMLKLHLRGRDITDGHVLAAMKEVPREEFVPKPLVHNSYGDHPLPLDSQATISQPYIVALMTQLAKPRDYHRALDIGTGSGYQAAILSELVNEVYSVEISADLASSAEERLSRLGYNNVRVKQGNGYQGWEEHAPYNLIIVAASPPKIPNVLVEQLAVGGRLIIPVGTAVQRLDVITKISETQITREPYCNVSFVRMIEDQ
ncbi:hypothetical protein NDN08_008176 [Rhodosorus marinus]|uniref:protein-L-isoaspartate(D-aspartate) O-methyltransferase n=1 Tax=Rhodosorus marinus TaxID=101924 RepID=A0AAV8V4H6_9RHOD|nr:hypothetical protein NDN08_008176 [Rhodosorus marinus]